MAPVLGYWKLRGLGQSIRFLLEYVGDDYEEKIYCFGPAPDYDGTEWTSVKFNLGLTLPNLPYYIDGDIQIVQSNAILRHIARKHDLCGKNEKQTIKVDILENQAMDIRNSYSRLVYGDYNAGKKEYMDNLPNTLKAISEILGNQKWLTGDEIMFPDFLFYELFDIHKFLEPTCLDSFPKLKAYVKRFEELPTIKKYMSSSKFIKYPLNGPRAGVGGK